MLHRVTLLILSIILSSAQCVRAEQPTENTHAPAIAESGGVQIRAIRVVREKASDAAKDADLTNMSVDLWFPWNTARNSPRYLVKFVDLSPIDDDTGKRLNTESRLDRIRFLNGDVNVTKTSTTRGTSGPIITLSLDAPARHAHSIKSLKGKAVVSQATFARLTFENLSSTDVQLEHPKLHDFPVFAKLEVKDAATMATIIVPQEHSRVEIWGLLKQDKMLTPYSEETSIDDGKRVLTATYEGDQTDGASLGIVICEPIATQVFEFEFEDVPLP